MFAPLFALVATFAQQSTRNPLVTETLDQAIPHVFRDKRYKVEFDLDLADAPVVYSFSKPTDPQTDLENFCKALFLETEFDESRMTVKIKKSQYLAKKNRKAEIATFIDKLRLIDGPLLNSDPNQIYAQAVKLAMAAKSEPDRVQKALLIHKSEILRYLLRTPDMILVRSLLSGSSLGILGARCSNLNHVLISPDSIPYLNQYLTGKGISTLDFVKYRVAPAETASVEHIGDQLRTEALKIAEKNPIPLVKHSSDDQGFATTLCFVSPDDVKRVGFCFSTFDDVLHPETINISPEVLKKKIEPISLFESPTFTINSLGTLAQDLDANFASWLSPRPLWLLEKSAFAWNNNFSYGLSAKLEHDWLSIYCSALPMSLSSKAWKPFFKIRELYDAKTVRRSELLSAISSLPESSIRGLEEIGADFQAMPRHYLVLTSGIRLFRAYLACLGSKTDSSPFARKFTYDQLPVKAKKDFLAFFSSQYIWDNYTQLFHPANLPRLSTTLFSVSYDPISEGNTNNFLQVDFPPDWNPIPLNAPLTFPVSTENMVP